MTLKEARIKAHLTQQAMSDLLGIPKRTIEEWETGRRKPPTYVEQLIVDKLNSMNKTEE
ncbi:MAG: helix-turn-helix transcriptional regulator [Clostridia bacterium]|nr:helix-turn-helix transcriptional regulator [Clostridia bacterium]